MSGDAYECQELCEFCGKRKKWLFRNVSYCPRDCDKKEQKMYAYFASYSGVFLRRGDTYPISACQGLLFETLEEALAHTDRTHNQYWEMHIEKGHVVLDNYIPPGDLPK